MYKYQFGFRKRHSTTLSLIETIDTIYSNLDNDNYVIGVFLDFQKAFDTADHKILLDKFSDYGLRGDINKWFSDFLSNRTQYTTHNNHNSTETVLNCGVPQGSVLGPLLFLIYITTYLILLTAIQLLKFLQMTLTSFRSTKIY